MENVGEECRALKRLLIQHEEQIANLPPEQENTLPMLEEISADFGRQKNELTARAYHIMLGPREEEYPEEAEDLDDFLEHVYPQVTDFSVFAKDEEDLDEVRTMTGDGFKATVSPIESIAEKHSSSRTRQRGKRRWDQPAEQLVAASNTMNGHARTLSVTQPKVQDDLIIAQEIVINDAEASIRNKLTKRPTQEDIHRSTAALVINRRKSRWDQPAEQLVVAAGESKAAKKREEDVEKKAETGAKKAEARRLALKKPDKKANRVSVPVPKVTEAELIRRREEEQLALAKKAEASKKKQARLAAAEERILNWSGMRTKKWDQPAEELVVAAGESKAAKKREEDVEKKAETAAKKAEARRLALKKPDKKANRVSVPVPKVTEAELIRRREEEQLPLVKKAIESKIKQACMAAEDEYEKMVLVTNTNRDDSLIEEALAKFTAYEEVELPRLKEEKPGLTHTQYKELIWKMWKKSPDNPLNQAAAE